MTSADVVRPDGLDVGARGSVASYLLYSCAIHVTTVHGTCRFNSYSGLFKAELGRTNIIPYVAARIMTPRPTDATGSWHVELEVPQLFLLDG